MRRHMGKAALVLSATLGLLGLVEAANIVVRGAWSWTIGPGDLQAGPGSELVGTYESSPDQVTMNVTGAGQGAWRVDAQRIDSHWHVDLILNIRRTGSGRGPGTVSGGTAYLTITTMTKAFVTGSGNRSGIPLQEQLRGVSVSIPAATYATTVLYTIVDR